MCIRGLKHVDAGAGFFFAVVVTGKKDKSKVFSKKKYPDRNDLPTSAVNQARMYASQLKLAYPDQRVFILDSRVEVTL